MRKSNFLCNYTYQKRFLKYQKPFCVLGRILFSFSFETVCRRYLFGFFLFDFSMFSAFGSQGFAFGKTFPAFDDGALLRLSAMASVQGIGRVCKSLGARRFFPIKSRESQCGRKDHIPGGMIIILCSKKSMYPMTVIILN